MQAIILAGGSGTRLRPLTYTTPKPMLPVANRPALSRTVDALARAGFSEVIITTNYLAGRVSEWLETLETPIPVRCIEENTPLGTAGCVKNCIDDLGDEFLIVQGDAVADVDYSAFLAFHRARKAQVSISAMRVTDTRDFGIMQTGAQGRIERFQEKPAPHEAFSDLANAGFYLVQKSIFDHVPHGVFFDFSRQLFPLLMAEGARFFAWEMDGYWIDIGQIAPYWAANQRLLHDQARDHPDSCVAPDARIDASCILRAPVLIGAGARLEANCVIGPNTIIGADCVVHAGAQLEGAILHHDVEIGADSRLHNCIIGAHSRLDERVTVEEMAVVGAGSFVGAEARLCEQSQVGPCIVVAPEASIEGVLPPAADPQPLCSALCAA